MAGPKGDEREAHQQNRPVEATTTSGGSLLVPIACHCSDALSNRLFALILVPFGALESTHGCRIKESTSTERLTVASCIRCPSHRTIVVDQPVK